MNRVLLVEDDPTIREMTRLALGLDGISVCRQIRARSVVPVVLLSARTDPIDIVVGLEAGADDYVTKPFEPPVLAARLRAVLRRVDRITDAASLCFGELES